MRTRWGRNWRIRLLAASCAMIVLLGPIQRAGAQVSATDLWFPVGEELLYRIYWGFIPVGTAHISTEWVEVDGERLVAIRYRVRTNKVFRHIYPVDDVAETLVAPELFLPRQFAVHLKRRRQQWKTVMVFDHANRQALQKAPLTGENSFFAIGPTTRDIVSCMYELRRTRLQPGEEKQFSCVGDEGVISVCLRAGGLHAVDLPTLGKRECLAVTPEANFGRLLIEQGHVVAWVSTDPRQLLTRMTIKAPVVDVKVVLCQVKGPGQDSWTETSADGSISGECEAEKDLGGRLRGELKSARTTGGRPSKGRT